MRLLPIVLCVITLGLASRVEAQNVPSVIIAFGDSITRGGNQFDEERRGGYPGRLQARLRRDDPNAKVHNFGRDSETTAQGVSRVLNVLPQVPNADAFTLMEGTNDVNAVIDGLISFESIAANLGTIASRASNAGLDVYLATIVPRPPSARLDNKNVLTFGVAREIRDLAFRKQHPLVDPFDEIFFIPGGLKNLYTKAAVDFVGHPNAAGFDVLADLFFDSVLGLDTHGPVPGDLEPGYVSESIGPATDIALTIYDFGAGIDRDNTSLTINGIEVETTQTGNDRRRTLSHDTTAASLGCFARVGIRSADLADPPNVSDHFYKEFKVIGGNILRGDLNRSCRVDGVDLLIVALAFGSQRGGSRYVAIADINDDGVVDGRDFAALASNFGRSS